MFKKTALVLVTIALLATLASCSKYGDLKDSMDKMSKSVDTFVADNGKATDAKTAAAAITAYAKNVKDNGTAWSTSFKKNSDVISNPPADLPADLKASLDKFRQIGALVAAELEKDNKTYGTDKEVQDAFALLYNDLKNTLENSVAAATKLETDMNAATDAKKVAAIITAYSDESRKDADAFDQILYLYPELQHSPDKPESLKQSITDFGTIDTKVVGAFAKADPFKTDAEVEKAFEKRYGNLKTGIDAMVVGADKFVADSEKAKDGKSIAAAIDAFAEINQATQKTISKEIRLFPELKSKGIEGLPPFLRDPLKKIGTLNDKIHTSITNAITTYVEPASNLRHLKDELSKESEMLKAIATPAPKVDAKADAESYKNLKELNENIDKQTTELLDLQAKGSEVLSAAVVEPLKAVQNLNKSVSGALGIANEKNLTPLKTFTDFDAKVQEVNAKLTKVSDVKSDVEKAIEKLQGGN